MHVYKVIVVRV